MKVEGLNLVGLEPYISENLTLKTAKFFLIIGSIAYFTCIIAPSPIEIQYYLAYSTIALGLILLLILRKVENEYIKFFFIFSLVFIMLRYFWWRTFNTINTDTPLNVLFSISLYFAEFYSITIALLGIFFSLKPITRKPIYVERKKLPTVDIFIPTYNEPPEIPEITALAALNMDYPTDKFNVYILDDGGTNQKLNDPDPEKRKFFRERAKELKKFVKKLKEKGYKNIHYLTRERNVHAKAGNINEALKKTNGDLILILDADHIPSKDFLRETVGFFIKYPNTFLVQTPHTFYNPDPLEKNLGIFGKVPGENQMFYFLIQKGFDLWNSSFFCGSAALLRRKYLEEIGGIQGITVTEDAETALELHSRGYDSIYYDKPMIYGLNPETLSAMIVQRIRWAQGMIQIFFLKKPLLKKGLRWYQKLAYFNASFFWFFGIARTIFLVAPLAYLFFGLHIYDASLYEVIAYPIPHFIASLLVAYYLFSKVRLPFFSEIYESIQGIFLFIPTILTLLRPQNPTFMVTPKGEQLERDFVSPFYTPFFIFYHLILFGFLFGLYKWFAYPDERGTVLITLWWNTFNFFIITIALYVAYEKRQRRKYHRIPANDEIILYLDNQTLHGRIVDLSLGGMAVKLTTDPPGNIKFEKGEQVKALIRDIENKIFYIEPEIVDYDKNKKILRFKFNWSPDDIEIVGKVVEIIFSPSARWQLILDIEREISPFEGFTLLAKNILKDFAKVYILIFNNFKKDFPNFIINIFKNTMEILWRRIKWVY